MALFRTLRSQIFFPFAGLIVTAVLGLGVWLATWAFGQQEAELALRLGDLLRTVAGSRFPLTPSVCEQLKGLTGAEFVLHDATGRQVASTLTGVELPAGPAALGLQQLGSLQITFERVWRIGDRDFYWSKVELPARGEQPGGNFLSALYPASRLEVLRRETLWPTLGIAVAASSLAIALAGWLATRITTPLGRVRAQLRKLAAGDLSSRLAFDRPDELGLLSADVDALAERLSDFESTIRRMERVRALGMLSGGLVHQLRNSATGARLAIDLHQDECPLGKQDESLTVARRQLLLMDRFIQKFLAFGGSRGKATERRDFGELIGVTLPLVTPFASHHQVELAYQPPECEDCTLFGDRESLEDLLLNLWLNAIEAVSLRPVEQGTRQVRTELRRRGQVLELTIIDNGPGIGPDVVENLFEPFVSGKPDGAGLGLAVAREICTAHHGTIRFERRGDLTCFVVELPADLPNPAVSEAGEQT